MRPKKQPTSSTESQSWSSVIAAAAPRPSSIGAWTPRRGWGPHGPTPGARSARGLVDVPGVSRLVVPVELDERQTAQAIGADVLGEAVREGEARLAEVGLVPGDLLDPLVHRLVVRRPGRLDGLLEDLDGVVGL